ncbi:MAG: glycosyltransferase family 2 protein [Verrucomicrobiae bacterium]|nr:glycosyltransferase family 2 protein [Verrucomicrobiae bacterium]
MKTSLLILHWKRPENVKRILDLECGYECVDEILVFNNNKDELFVYDHPKVKALNASCDFGLRTRWILGALAQNDCLVFQDDDILLAEEAFLRFARELEQDPDRAYSLHGRNPASDIYTQKPAVGDVAIVLTRATCIHRKHIPLILECERRFRAKFGFSVNNGEDIFLSYCLSTCYGKMHKIIQTHHKNLLSPHAISDRANHLAQRTELLRSCLKFFSGPHGEEIRCFAGIQSRPLINSK